MSDDLVDRYPLPVEKVQKIKKSLDSAEYVAFLPNDYMVVADSERRSVKFFDPNGKFSTTLSHGLKPLGIATNRSGMVAVVYGSKKQKVIKVFSSDGGDIFSNWGEDMHWKPRGMTFSNKGQLIVTNVHKTKHSVGIYTLDGRELHSFGSFGSGPQQFNNPWYVTVDMFDRILVSDKDNDCIKIFDDKGRYLSRVGRSGSGPGCLSKPHGICTDSRANIIVCDTGNKRVTMFATTGEYIQDILTSKDFLSYPFGMDFSKATRHLVVSQHRSAENGAFKKIRVYKLAELSPLKMAQLALPRFEKLLEKHDH